MGFNPSKFCCCLNVLTNLGYGMMSAMVGGQLLSQMTDGAVSVVIGIIIVALVSLVVATFGMHIFQFYERYSHPLFHFLYRRKPQNHNNRPQIDMPGAHSWPSFVFY